MTKTCLGCGFASTDARYCRMCGTPLPGARDEYAGEVSPQAATVPLSGIGRQETGDIMQQETRQPLSPPTAAIGGGEARDFWRGVEGVAPGAGGAGVGAERGGEGPGADGGSDRPLTIPVRPMDAAHGGPPTRDLGDAPHLSEDTTRYAEDESTRVAIREPTRPPATTPAAPAVSTPEKRALSIWAGLAIFGVVVVVLTAGAAGVGWYFLRSLRNTGEQPGAVVAPTAEAPTTDASAQVVAKLAEAEGLIAAGRKDEAVALLREAAALDPTNAEPHRRLARLLLEAGARRTAIEELRAVVRIDPSDAKAWRELADAQLAEGLHRDAADSYRRLNEMDEGARADDRVQLSYADALRLSGREADAKAVYQRLASSGIAEVARASRQRLAQLAREEKEENSNAQEASATPSPTASPGRRDESAQVTPPEVVRPAATPPPPPAAPLSPNERYERGVRTWGSNRSAAVADFAAAAQAGNADANYYLGLNLAEGREPRALKRGELMGAITYFQRARRGRHGAEARRYEEQLLREYDRRQAAGEKQ